MFNKLISSNLLKDWKTFSVFAGVSYGASQLLRKYLFIDNCDFYDVVIMFMIFYASFLILSIFKTKKPPGTVMGFVYSPSFIS